MPPYVSLVNPTRLDYYIISKAICQYIFCKVGQDFQIFLKFISRLTENGGKPGNYHSRNSCVPAPTSCFSPPITAEAQQPSGTVKIYFILPFSRLHSLATVPRRVSIEALTKSSRLSVTGRKIICSKPGRSGSEFIPAAAPYIQSATAP